MTEAEQRAFRQGVVEGIRLYHEALHRGAKVEMPSPTAVVSDPPARAAPPPTGEATGPVEDE